MDVKGLMASPDLYFYTLRSSQSFVLYAGIFHGLFFNPVDGDDMFLQNIS
jgi:hypothetical protein